MGKYRRYFPVFLLIGQISLWEHHPILVEVLGNNGEQLLMQHRTTSSTDWLINIRSVVVGILSSNLVSLNDFRTSIPNAVK
ncbi:hypothetical protein [Paenibacillus sp. N3.4]|uniref:hypothetical protein n=1 Tax=Paenibacillus sp. N3.4 TaxID=2603222 RepID=UPI0011CBE516|nr:hypothetical protein [Paenibacillus sp. N3.4]TXK80687.1 hypothetical protein FU659_17885 [Paenibacillus sp. N3.4]